MKSAADVSHTEQHRVSICIPTLNRKAWLQECLESITRCANNSDVQVCISDNRSDEPINDSLAVLSGFRGTVKFVQQPKRLPLDEHMYEVTKLADGEYVFYLGDDDVLIADLADIVKYISRRNPDVLVLGAMTVDKNGVYIRDVCADRHEEITDADLAYRLLSQYAAFGAIIVKRSLLNLDYFRRFFGTLHAYGCFWPLLQNRHADGLRTVVAVIGGRNVALRSSTKSYDPMYLSVALEKSMVWCDVSSSIVKSSRSHQAISDWRKDHRRRMLRFRQFITFRLKNVSSRELASFYFKNGPKGLLLAVLTLAIPYRAIYLAAQCWRWKRVIPLNRNVTTAKRLRGRSASGVSEDPGSALKGPSKQKHS